jgi:hypothetical protein
MTFLLTAAGMNIALVRTAQRSAWQTADVERDRLDPTRVPGPRDRLERGRIAPRADRLRRHYTRLRTHLALGKDAPRPRPAVPSSAGRVVAAPQVDGLHHRYYRIAA